MIFLWLTNNPHSEEKLKQQVAFLNSRHEGKQVTYRIEMVKNRPVRSVDQNRMYWAILTAIGAHIGETKENLHEWYRLQFIPVEFGGKMIPRSTTELDTAEMSTYIKQVEQHAKDFHGLVLPDVRDQYYTLWERTNKNSYDALFQ